MDIEVIVRGPADSGKTSLIRLIVGVLKAAGVQWKTTNPNLLNKFGENHLSRLTTRNPFVTISEFTDIPHLYRLHKPGFLYKHNEPGMKRLFKNATFYIVTVVLLISLFTRTLPILLGAIGVMTLVYLLLKKALKSCKRIFCQ